MEETILKFIKDIKNMPNNNLSISNISIKNPNIFVEYNGIEGKKKYEFEDINNNNEEIKINIKEKKINLEDNIICHECKNICMINFNNYKFSLYNCVNKHKREFSLEEFILTQKKTKKCTCRYCLRNACELNMKLFYCLECQKEICEECMQENDQNHRNKIIEEDKKINYCKDHYKEYISYCLRCNKNLCEECKCLENHKNQIIEFGTLKPKYDVKKDLKNISEKIKSFLNQINSIIDVLNYVKNIFKIIKKINRNIINSYNNKNHRYEIYKNLQNIKNFNDYILKDLSPIIDENNVEKKIKQIYKLYNL